MVGRDGDDVSDAQAVLLAVRSRPDHDERISRMPDAKELLYSNLHEVFSERDPERRRAVIERTYVEDVTFIDPEGEVVGRQALSDRAQKLGPHRSWRSRRLRGWRVHDRRVAGVRRQRRGVHGHPGG